MNKKIVIVPTYSPSKNHLVLVLGDVTKVKMSCGGGMGGSKWYEFGGFENKPKIGEFVNFVDAVSGETKIINPNYIVEVEEKKLVKVTTDVTEWKNYNKKVCNKAIHIAYYWFDKTDKVIGSVERYGVENAKSERSLEDNLIYSEIIME